MSKHRLSDEQRSFRVLGILPSLEGFAAIRRVIEEASEKAGATAKFFSSESERIITGSFLSPEPSFMELRKADLIIADLTQPTVTNFYEMGFAQASGKPIVYILNQNSRRFYDADLNLSRNLVVTYLSTKNGLARLRNNLTQFIRQFRVGPGKLTTLFSMVPSLQLPYIIEPETLSPREFENLCFELLTQIGLRRIEWGVTVRDIDVVATLPKKDPDGFQYEEMWFVLIGSGGERRPPTGLIIEKAIRNPQDFIEKTLRYPQQELASRPRTETPITLLIIAQNEQDSEFFEEFLKRNRPRILSGASFRIRVWGVRYVTNLIQQYPQLAFKYFSESAKPRGGEYRKTYEELYRENAMLSERLQITVSDLEQEKKRRFIAERDAAWKDVAFKAAHKLGNPIDAVDTYIPGLKKRIEGNKVEEAVKILDNITVSIEEAKGVISQFKSLVRAQQFEPKKVAIQPIIEQACKIAAENGVTVNIEAQKDIPLIWADPERMSEVFNELVANSLHWLKKEIKRIDIKLELPNRKSLPTTLSDSSSYIKIKFGDNGCGVPSENKEKVFAPFFTTYPHGTGLGLSLVKWIVEQHGGTIFENGKQDEGASFEIFMPIGKKPK